MWQGVTTCYPYALPPTTQVTGQVTDYQHQIKDPVSCETGHCVYYWKCKKDNCKNYPKCEYIGLTTRSYKQRIAEHKQYIRSNLLEKPSGFHFNQPGHCLANMKTIILEQVKTNDKSYRLEREKYFINKFNTYYEGLNKE